MDKAPPEELLRRERDCWRHADLILCASEFTRRSLLEVGCDAQCCRIVPYGVDLPAFNVGQATTEGFHAIFVGSGGQRKGLHHLLLAWQNTVLPPGSRLTLVCRVLDDGIKRMLAEMPEVELRRGVSLEELHRLYATSSLFVMPSLVEGFGQVYLEALSHGCPVLGTRNTCLPDIGGEADGIFIVSPGNVEELSAKLGKLARTLVGIRDPAAAQRSVASHTWQGFQESLRPPLAEMIYGTL